MPYIFVVLVFSPQKNQIASLNYFICEASASIKVKFHGTNLPIYELNNFTVEMFLFYKGYLITENMSANKHVFKATFHSDTTGSHNAEEFFRGYSNHNKETTNFSYRRYDVYFN